MIGEAFYALLMSLTAITSLVDDRITSVIFPEEGSFPAIAYNIRDKKAIACRLPGNSKAGILEIELLANDEVELEALADAVDESLRDFDGVVMGFALAIEENTDEFDERVDDLSAFGKVLQYTYYATKL